MTPNLPSWFAKLPADKRRKVLAHAVRVRAELNPLRWIRRPDGTFGPLAWMEHQRRAWQLFGQCKVTGMIGGNRLGKTIWAAGVVAEVALGLPHDQWSALPLDPRTWTLGPPKTIWCVALNYEKSRDVQQRELWDRIPRALWSDTWGRKRGFATNVAALRNGTNFHFKSEEQALRTFESSAVDLVWIDETVGLPYFLACLPRLVDRQGKLIWTTIPDDPFLDDLFFSHELDPDARQTLRPEDVGVVTGTMRDNVYLAQSEIEFLERTLPPDERVFRVAGRFARKQGLVYADYHADVHDEHFEPPLPYDWLTNRYEVIDPGWRNPCAVLFAALDGADVVHVYDEVYARERTVGEIAAAIYLKRWAWAGKLPAARALEFERLAGLERAAVDEPLATTQEWMEQDRRLHQLLRAWRGELGELPARVTLCDEYGAQHYQSGPVSFISQLAEFGVRAAPARNAGKEAQRTALRSWLRPMNGLVRLRIGSRCPWTRWELRHHRYDKPDAELGEYRGDKERVVEVHNHTLACLEYLAAHAPRYVPLEAEPAPVGTVLRRHQELAAARGSGWRSRG